MICPYQDLGQPEEDWCENPENCEIYKERIQEKEKLAKRNLMLTAEQRGGKMVFWRKTRRI